MYSVRGVITAVQEGRFLLATDSGQVLPVVLSHRAAAEPQDLLQLKGRTVRVRVDCSPGKHLIAAVAHRIEVEE
jgi:hypothetical protein